MAAVIAIKARLGDDLRRWSTPADQLSLDKLRAEVQAHFGQAESPALRWIDSDGDHITLGTEADLQEAVRECTGGTLRVEVAAAAPPEAATSVRDIKAELLRLGVSFAGLLEKSELLTRLTQARQAANTTAEQTGSHQPGAAEQPEPPAGPTMQDFIAQAAQAAQHFAQANRRAAEQPHQPGAAEQPEPPAGPTMQDFIAQAAQAAQHFAQANRSAAEQPHQPGAAEQPEPPAGPTMQDFIAQAAQAAQHAAPLIQQFMQAAQRPHSQSNDGGGDAAP